VALREGGFAASDWLTPFALLNVCSDTGTAAPLPARFFPSLSILPLSQYFFHSLEFGSRNKNNNMGKSAQRERKRKKTS